MQPLLYLFIGGHHGILIAHQNQHEHDLEQAEKNSQKKITLDDLVSHRAEN